MLKNLKKTITCTCEKQSSMQFTGAAGAAAGAADGAVSVKVVCRPKKACAVHGPDVREFGVRKGAGFWTTLQEIEKTVRSWFPEDEIIRDAVVACLRHLFAGDLDDDAANEHQTTFNKTLKDEFEKLQHLLENENEDPAFDENIMKQMFVVFRYVVDVAGDDQPDSEDVEMLRDLRQKFRDKNMFQQLDSVDAMLDKLCFVLRNLNNAHDVDVPVVFVLRNLNNAHDVDVPVDIVDMFGVMMLFKEAVYQQYSGAENFLAWSSKDESD
jgi:hypothetical protein